MNKLNEKVKDCLYGIHILATWGGASYEIAHIFNAKSAQDVTLIWVVGLLISHIVALPRVFGSPYGVWKICHVGSVLLAITLLISVIIYGGNE